MSNDQIDIIWVYGVASNGTLKYQKRHWCLFLIETQRAVNGVIVAAFLLSESRLTLCVGVKSNGRDREHSSTLFLFTFRAYGRREIDAKVIKNTLKCIRNVHDGSCKLKSNITSFPCLNDKWSVSVVMSIWHDYDCQQSLFDTGWYWWVITYDTNDR